MKRPCYRHHLHHQIEPSCTMHITTPHTTAICYRSRCSSRSFIRSRLSANVGAQTSRITRKPQQINRSYSLDIPLLLPRNSSNNDNSTTIQCDEPIRDQTPNLKMLISHRGWRLSVLLHEILVEPLDLLDIVFHPGAERGDSQMVRPFFLPET